MDENTAPDNFLTHSFNLKPGTDTWRFLQNQFEEAYKMKDVITHIPTRTQNRLHRYTPVPPADVMKNEPDTDFDLAQNQEWVRNIFAKWKKSPADSPEIIPLQIGAETVVCEKRHKYMDRCQDDEVCVCEMSQADAGQVMKILEIAEKILPDGERPHCRNGINNV